MSAETMDESQVGLRKQLNKENTFGNAVKERIVELAKGMFNGGSVAQAATKMSDRNSQIDAAVAGENPRDFASRMKGKLTQPQGEQNYERMR